MLVEELDSAFMGISFRRGRGPLREAEVEQVAPPGQVQGRRGGRLAPALFEEIGDVFAGISVKGQGVLEGAGGVFTPKISPRATIFWT